MADVWFISDTHLGHKNILNFKRNDGTPLRPFSSTWEMEGCIFERWCEVVKPQDKIYHLGDVAFTKGSLERMLALPGHKRLVRGNHDLFKMKTYTRIFEEVYGVRQLDGFWFTHVPIHEGSMGQRVKLNVHGHLHANKVMSSPHIEDKRYYNVSVECIDYRPINFDELKAYAK